MAVVCDALSVLIPARILEERWPGGPEGYASNAPNRTFCSDGLLTRIGFMTPNDVSYWVDLLRDRGYRFVEEINGIATFVDIAVVDQLAGPTAHCPWIVSEVRDGVRWSWLAGQEPGDLVGPAGWTPSKSASMHFVPPEVGKTLPAVRSGELISILDPEGVTRFVAPPVKRELGYDDSIASATAHFEAGDAESAFRALLKAEHRRPLEPEDRRLAANIATSFARELKQDDDPRAGKVWINAARRWRELTDLSSETPDAAMWAARGEAELESGDIPRARESLGTALRMSPSDWRALATMALVAFAEGKPVSDVDRWLDRAAEAAEGDERAEDKVDDITHDISVRRRKANRPRPSVARRFLPQNRSNAPPPRPRGPLP